MMRGRLIAAFLLCASPAAAHTHWANGDPIPAWVRSSCCGAADAHQLDPSQVSEEGDEYVVQSEGLTIRVPVSKALPSQDGEYWIFYPPGETSPYVYCFFVPMAS